MDKNESVIVLIVTIVAVVGLIMNFGGTGAVTFGQTTPTFTIEQRTTPEVGELGYAFRYPQEECFWDDVLAMMRCPGVETDQSASWYRGAPREYRTGNLVELRNLNERVVDIGELGPNYQIEEFQEGGKRYYYQSADGGWVEIDTSDIRR